LTAKLGEVGTATVVEVVEAPANVVAAASATVTATATGTIGSLLVTDGANVRKGRLLFVIDSPDTDRALATARAAVANAPRPVDLPGIDTSASSEQASTSADQAFGRAREAARQIPNRQLRRQALQQVTAAKAQFDSAQAQATATASQLNQAIAGLEQALGSLTRVQLTQAQAGLTAARQANADLRVRAPISGRVVLAAGAGDGGGTSSLSGIVDQLPDSVSGQAESLLGGGASGGSTTGTLQTGSPVTAGDPLLAITDVSSLSLRAEVDETDVLLVRKGVKADVELDAVPGASYRAVVRNVDLAPTTSARGGVTYVVRLDLRGGTAPDGAPAPRPRPGMSAIASLRVAVAKDALAVPVSAVFRDEDDDAVWFVDNGVAEARAVTIGAQGESFLQVIDGLQLGDPIATSGADLVTDGDELS
jgi:multidrug efflux pump subunit AcrA (membrane-fusion protein)